MLILHDEVPPHLGRGYNVFEWKLSTEVGRIRWTNCMASGSPDLIPLHFCLWGYMKSKMYHTGKLETRQQLLQHINENHCCSKKMHQNNRCSVEWCQQHALRMKELFQNVI